MKRLLVNEASNLNRMFKDDAEVNYSEAGIIVVSDSERVVILNLNYVESLELLPVEEDEVSACGPNCGCGQCDANCACHDLPFDCKGECKNRCYECQHQAIVIDGDAGAATPFIGEDGGD